MILLFHWPFTGLAPVCESISSTGGPKLDEHARVFLCLCKSFCPSSQSSEIPLQGSPALLQISFSPLVDPGFKGVMSLEVL